MNPIRFSSFSKFPFILESNALRSTYMETAHQLGIATYTHYKN